MGEGDWLMPLTIHIDRADINPHRLDQELRERLAQRLHGLAFDGAVVTVVLADESSAADRSAVRAAVRDHDPARQTPRQQQAIHRATARQGYRLATFADRSPQQITSYFEGQIDGWTSLAEAKADLRVWLPLFAQVLTYLVVEEDENQN
jgi:hypothetical protein